MFGGQISGGEAAEGSNIYVGTEGAFNKTGGTVENEETTVFYAQ